MQIENGYVPPPVLVNERSGEYIIKPNDRSSLRGKGQSIGKAKD